MEEAHKAGGHESKLQLFVSALRTRIQRRRQQEIVKLFGTIDFDPAYDYKRQRRGEKVSRHRD